MCIRDSMGAGSLHGRSTGDLFVRVVVETPTKVTGSQKKELKEAFKSLEGQFKEYSRFNEKLQSKIDE